MHYKSNRAMAEKIVEEICGIGRRATAVQADVGDAAAVEAMHAEIVRELGDADIVVTNAVAQYKWVSVLEQGLEDYESQFRTCVMQNVLMAKAFVPAMIRKGGGRIIAINTECAMQCFPSQSAYVSGKRGMDGLLRVLAREIGPHGITVNQIAPGWTVSDRDRATHSERQPEHEAKIPLRHRGEDTDIANAVAFLASDLVALHHGRLPARGRRECHADDLTGANSDKRIANRCTGARGRGRHPFAA